MQPSPAASSVNTLAHPFALPPRRIRRRFGLYLALLLILIPLLAACTQRTPTPEPPAILASRGSCALSVSGDDDAAAIAAVLRAEGEFVVAQDIELLMRLWDDDGRVSDAKNTPDDTSDDQNWIGRDAVRHRYVRTVFPGAPSQVQRIDPHIVIEGNRAVVDASVRISGGDVSGGDRWELVKRDGCWLLAGLTYNLEPVP